MTARNLILFCAILIFSLGCTSQKPNQQQSNNKKKFQLACVAFYNLENLFDTINHVGVRDEEYTPEGSYKWNYHKYSEKQQKMAYAISQFGLDETPVGAAIVGVCEVENRFVLEDLVARPEIANRSYQIVHYDGPDRRGVDVALLYNPRFFVVSNSVAHTLNTPEDPKFRTRDQLLVSGYLFDEKVHIIVNHWPSRYGGELRSRPKRAAAAKLTRSIVDSLYQVEPQAKIIIMGDLNDDPHNESVAKVLGAKKNIADITDGDLYNTMWNIHEKGIGTLAYRGQWNFFDQIIISSFLLKASTRELKFWKSEVFNANFLRVQEGESKGTPLRTHSKGVWQNGYSDHFPTMIYVIKEKK